MPEELPYRDFYYPLNVFMHILTHEGGSVSWLHYGLFDSPDESLTTAQERSTAMLLERLPPPPASLLEVGIGLATTLDRLTRLGYDVTGITPDEKQIAMARAKYGDSIDAACSAFESFEPGRTYDTVLFQESSQYIESEALFAKAAQLTRRVVVLDEFSLAPVDSPGALHSLADFLAAAQRHGYRVKEQIDVSAKASPTIEYFTARLPRYRDRLIADLGLTGQQIDDLIASGEAYVQRYRDAVYGYRLLVLERETV